MLRTADAVSAHGSTELSLTLAMFVLVYGAVFGSGTAYVLRLLRQGPAPHAQSGPPSGGPGQERQPMRPISAASEAGSGGAAPEA